MRTRENARRYFFENPGASPREVKAFSRKVSTELNDVLMHVQLMQYLTMLEEAGGPIHDDGEPDSDLAFTTH